MRQRRIIVISCIVVILATSLLGLWYILFGPKPDPYYYTIAMPHVQSYGNFTLNPSSARSSRRAVHWTPQSVPSRSNAVSPSELLAPSVTPISHLSSKARTHTFGVMPYAGGGYQAATATNTSTHHSSPTAVAAPVMPITHFLALSSAKTLSERTAAAAPVVNEPAPAPMARMATAPHYAPGPPNTGGGLEPGNDPDHQLTDPTPVGDSWPLLLFALLAAAAVWAKQSLHLTSSRRHE